MISPKLLGLLLGLVAGLLLVLVGWKILLILAVFACIGYLIGLGLETRADIFSRVRDFITRFLRSR